MKTVKLENGTIIKVVYPKEKDLVLTTEDKEMDIRAQEAVRAAVEKIKFLKSLRKE